VGRFKVVDQPGDHGDHDGPDEPELGPGSMLFLRVVSALVVAIVVFFLIDAILG